MDKLFHTGFMTFKDNGEAEFWTELDAADRKRRQLPSKLSLRKPMSSGMKAYMAYHRKEVFKGDSE
ncbi:MAG: hypothetical protein L3K26_01365 [Candidatus Hydrogenedentes bacterium]|nr:hypothetical protein [Candidatus Hydrogenedentota bacterium]